MVFKGLVAATASVALMVTPAMAASTSARAASSELAPASEDVLGSELDGGGSIIVIILALIAAGLGLWVLLDDKNAPNSP